ncbi:hypothetical protein BKA70DRAFT_1242825 [Coprinopsis sp. MPI-PUGE-AT-0042]|nr:hypothetical protein BKA70DRAFT_1242825 [Coprinopsis sp. MPI-PUGE-AT-0042]
MPSKKTSEKAEETASEKVKRLSSTLKNLQDQNLRKNNIRIWQIKKQIASLELTDDGSAAKPESRKRANSAQARSEVEEQKQPKMDNSGRGNIDSPFFSHITVLKTQPETAAEIGDANGEKDAEMQLLEEVKDFELKAPKDLATPMSGRGKTMNTSQRKREDSDSDDKPEENDNEEPEHEEDEDAKASGSHLPERWDHLTSVQKALLQIHPSHLGQAPVPFWVKAGDHSYLLALIIHIMKKGITCCATHTTLDKKLKKNDIKAEKNKKSTTKPMAVPKLSKTFAEEDSAGDEDSEERPLSHDEVLQRVIQCFPLRQGRRTLHCGCDLKEALFGLWFFKRFPTVSSRSTNTVEAVRPLDPLTRRIVFNLVTGFLRIDIDNIYRFDTYGTHVSPQASPVQLLGVSGLLSEHARYAFQQWWIIMTRIRITWMVDIHVVTQAMFSTELLLALNNHDHSASSDILPVCVKDLNWAH